MSCIVPFNAVPLLFLIISIYPVWYVWLLKHWTVVISKHFNLFRPIIEPFAQHMVILFQFLYDSFVVFFLLPMLLLEFGKLTLVIFGESLIVARPNFEHKKFILELTVIVLKSLQSFLIIANNTHPFIIFLTHLLIAISLNFGNNTLIFILISLYVLLLFCQMLHCFLEFIQNVLVIIFPSFHYHL